MPSDADTIYDGFTECPLAPLEGEPTYEYLTDLGVYLNACSSGIHSDLGCGTLGYLVLTAQPAVFAVHCATAFVKPIKPGIHPTIPNPAPAAAVISTIVREHKEDMRVWKEYNMTDKACKKVVHALIPEKFYKSLSSRIVGFTKVTCLEILTHLITEYGTLEDPDIQDIDKKMKEQITGETLFEEFIEQIEWNQEAVSVQNPYTAAQIISIAFTNVNQSNIYPDDCRDWKRKPAHDKTWANFKTHFARAFKEAKKTKDTSKDLGYSAHLQSMQSRNQANAEMFSEMQQDHNIALANLATATKSDRESVSLMSKTISELTTQIATITKQLSEAHIEISRLQGNKSTNGGGGPSTPRSTNPMISKSGKEFDPMGYC